MELLKNTIPRYRNCGQYSENFTESGDAIVSDVNPDVMSIVNTEANLVIREKTVLKGSVKLTGEIQAQIYYQAYESEELFVTSAKLPFTHLCEVDCGEADVAAAEVSLLAIQTNMLNPRKVTCRAELALRVEIFRLEQYRYLEGIKSQAEERVQVKTRDVEEWVLTGVSQKRMTTLDELRLSGSEMPEGSRILRWDLNWSTEETKVLSRKVMVRGNARIDLTILSPNGRLVTRASYGTSFSQIVECETAEPGDHAEVRYMPLASAVRLITRPDGAAALDYDLSAELTVMTRRTIQYRVLEDAYSTAYEMEVQPCICSPEGRRCPQLLEAAVTEKIVPEGPAVRVQDISVRPCAASAVCGASALQADYYVKVLYETADGLICSACKRVSAELQSGRHCTCSCCYIPKADGITASVDPEGVLVVSFRALLELDAPEEQAYPALADCSIDRERPRKDMRRGSLILRTVCEGEDVWSIAKAYRTPPDDIRSANRLEPGAGIESGRLLIIPFMG